MYVYIGTRRSCVFPVRNSVVTKAWSVQSFESFEKSMCEPSTPIQHKTCLAHVVRKVGHDKMNDLKKLRQHLNFRLQKPLLFLTSISALCSAFVSVRYRAGIFTAAAGDF